MKWFYYVMLAIVDVEANYLGKASSYSWMFFQAYNRDEISWFTIVVFYYDVVVKAYQYTSFTSVMLLDCCTIPCVIFLTWIFLKTKYGYRKFAGIAICIAGLVLVVFSDVHSGDRAGTAVCYPYMLFLQFLTDRYILSFNSNHHGVLYWYDACRRANAFERWSTCCCWFHVICSQ